MEEDGQLAWHRGRTSRWTAWCHGHWRFVCHTRVTSRCRCWCPTVDGKRLDSSFPNLFPGFILRFSTKGPFRPCLSSSNAALVVFTHRSQSSRDRRTHHESQNQEYEEDSRRFEDQRGRSVHSKLAGAACCRRHTQTLTPLSSFSPLLSSRPSSPWPWPLRPSLP